MNRTLEAVARSLFTSWFVDFDPVVRKAAAQQPFGVYPEIESLFSGTFVESELGPIPGGWEHRKLGDLIEINARSIGSDYPHQLIEYIDISSVSVGRLELTTTYKLGAAPSRARRLLRDGDTIWSCVRPNRRSYLYVDDPPENVVASTGFAVLSPRDLPPSFLYHLVTTASFTDYLAANAEGSAYPAVRPDVFSRAELVLPPRPLLEAFERIARPLRRLIARNERDAQRLEVLRDALLTPLLSGDITVGRGAKLAKQAV